jgi:hypothetical protein
MPGIAEKIIKPGDCLLAISLPLKKEDFIRDLYSDSKDYAKSRKMRYKFNDDALWETDHAPFVESYKKYRREMTDYGLTVKEDFRISDLRDIGKYDVTTFITHSIVASRQIEFYDGLYTDADFVENLPVAHNKILDLTICNSIFLQDAIKQKYKECIVFANKHPANLDFRLIFYRSLMKLLFSRDLNYLDAFTELRLNLISESQNHE